MNTYRTEIGSNRGLPFGLFNNDGSKRQYIERAFLSVKWMKAKDLEVGFLVKDNTPYQVSVSQKLFQRLISPDFQEGFNPYVKTICSFQIWKDGQRVVVCKEYEDKKEGV